MLIFQGVGSIIIENIYNIDVSKLAVVWDILGPEYLLVYWVKVCLQKCQI